MRYAALVLVLLVLASCRQFENDAQFGYSINGPTAASVFTTADIRIVTERENPVTHQKVVCTEPSPDVAKAISTAFALSGQGSGGTGQPGASGSFSGATAEAVTELAGRSTALLGLRDGLYRACEAYANGAIGSDMYALIISHYGQLMTTLFLGQDISGMPQPIGAAASPGITVNASAPGGSSATPGSQVQVNSGTAQSQAGTAPTAISGAANAVVRLNEDYLDIDYNILHMLTVACINQADPTVKTAPDGQGHLPNPWLDEICRRIKNDFSLQALGKMAQIPEALVKANVLAHPVDPTATGSSSTPKTPAATAATTKATPSNPTKAQVTKLQDLLIAAKACPSDVLKTADGTWDWRTQSCLAIYQEGQKMAPNDNPIDPVTLAKLKAAVVADPPAPIAPPSTAPDKDKGKDKPANQ
jgi:hypothetical protein